MTTALTVTIEWAAIAASYVAAFGVEEVKDFLAMPGTKRRQLWRLSRVAAYVVSAFPGKLESICVLGLVYNKPTNILTNDRSWVALDWTLTEETGKIGTLKLITGTQRKLTGIVTRQGRSRR